jgi:hypothetical protein
MKINTFLKRWFPLSMLLCSIVIYLCAIYFDTSKKKRGTAGLTGEDTSDVSSRFVEALPNHIHASHSNRPTFTAYKLTKLDTGIQIPFDQALKLSLFIENDLPRFIAQNIYFLPTSDTRLKFPIEHDPETHLTFIHLGECKEAYIGRGRFKTVTKSILYDSNEPIIVANCETESPCSEEIAITQTLQGKNGLAKVYAIMKRQIPDRPVKTLFLCKYYNGGNLHRLIKSKSGSFTFDETLQIGIDLLTGLKNMHEMQITHRDLGPRNHFIELCYDEKIKKIVMHAVIGDLGRAISISEAPGKGVQGNPDYIAPEVLDYKKLKPRDYLSTDIYALGYVFYKIYYNKSIPQYYSKADYRENKDLKNVQKEYRENLFKIQRRRAPKVHDEKEERSAQVQFESLILQMIHPDPEMRGSADTLFAKITKISDMRRNEIQNP